MRLRSALERFATFVPLLLLLALLPRDAAAQTAVYYSKPENTYGWCADYGSYAATRQCAQGYCAQSGSDCRLVLECEGGWAAIASSQNGFGAACKRNSTFYARQWALVYCIVASGELCGTDYTFYGGTQQSEAENKAFDDAWYAQLLLQRVGYDLGIVDGVVGAKTRKAIRDYQQSRGLPVTGEITSELMDKLLAEKGGVSEVVAIVKRELYEDETNPSPDITYGASRTATPVADTAYADALAAYNAGDFATAQRLWQGLADRGEPIAQYNLGLLYEDGKGVAQDYARAADWYRRAAEQGHASAQLNLGHLYDQGLGVAKDLALAADWYRKAAEQGDALAQDSLGYLYENGRGVPKDYAEAAAWYRKAADQGLAQAQADLGYMYEMGYGVPEDRDLALEWYRKAAAQGDEDAEEALWWLEEEEGAGPTDGTTSGEAAATIEEGRKAILAGDYDKALQLFRPLAEAGEAEAQVGMAFAYYDGLGVPQDHAQALAWFTKAAEQGHALAANNLGYMHRNGQGGVPASDAEAAIWFRKAAEGGDDNGQVNYAEMLEKGLGVPHDVAQALDWYRKAAAQGHETAQAAVARLEAAGAGTTTAGPTSADDPLAAFNAGDYALAAKLWRAQADQGDSEAQFGLAYLYEQGLGVAKDPEQAVLLYRRAADQGHTMAQNNLAVMHEAGTGVAQDHAEAAHWYRKAAEQGYALAQRNLAQMYETGRGVPADLDQALLWYRRAAAQGEAEAQAALQRLGG